MSIDIDRGEGKLIFERVYYIARFANYRGVNHPVFARAVVDHDGQLHITGVEGPKRNGDCWGSCGQIEMDWRERGWTTKGADFNDEQLAEFMAIWDRWHLNHMRAGSPAQMAWLREHPIKVNFPESHYDKAKLALREAGLDPDPAHDHYRYGSAWKHEELPAEVVEKLASFPASSLEPAWV